VPGITLGISAPDGLAFTEYRNENFTTMSGAEAATGNGYDHESPICDMLGTSFRCGLQHCRDVVAAAAAPAALACWARPRTRPILSSRN
jgi:hypothetical protein